MNNKDYWINISDIYIACFIHHFILLIVDYPRLTFETI
jgi:hypothetical protein